MQVVAQGALRIVEQSQPRLIFRRKRTSYLVPGTRYAAPTSPVLRPVWDCYHELPAKLVPDGSVGVEVSQLAKQAIKRYGSLDSYTDRVVIPELVSRGYLAPRPIRILGLTLGNRHERTPLGEQARAELQRRMNEASQEIAGWVENDPRRAMAYLTLAGASVLLVPTLFPYLQDLSRRIERERGTGDSAGSGDGGSVASSGSFSGPSARQDEGRSYPEERGYEPSTELPGDPSLVARESLASLGLNAPDLGSMDFSSLDFSSLDFDFSSFDSLDSAFSAIDSGVDSGGGGDGGGGDGGGGGGD